MRSLRVVRRLLVATAITAIATGTTGCVVSRSVHSYVVPVDAHGTGGSVTSPVKASLRDGSIVLFRRGVQVDGDSLRALREPAQRFTATLGAEGTVGAVALSDVVGAERFQADVNSGRTVLYSTGTTLAWFVALIAIMAAAIPPNWN